MNPTLFTTDSLRKSTASAPVAPALPLNINGRHYIGGQWQADKPNQFSAINAVTFEPLPWLFAECQATELDNACEAAHQAFLIYREKTVQERAALLRQMAQELRAAASDIIAIARQETALTELRLQGELTRTCNQLLMFAEALETQPEGLVVLDKALPERQPPRPQLELTQLPLGPVAVFAASNFPLAFSVAGGDTASALAAGCTVVVKAHSAHPATSDRVMQALVHAIELCEMPKALLSLVQAKNYDISHQLVKHPRIKAMAFTGSFRVGMALKDSIHQRAEPIPCYAELGSLNPQLVLPELALCNATELAQQLVASTTGSGGQLCTKPGLWLLPHTAAAELLLDSAISAMQQVQPQTLLHPGIYKTYQAQTAERALQVKTLASGARADKQAGALLFSCSLNELLATPELWHEIFGPCALVVRYHSLTELAAFIEKLPGQLAATVHGYQAGLPVHQALLTQLEYQVGRIILSQMPTGVEVCASMQHGGPFPSSSDVRSTSVGLAAMQRFLRPLCRQNFPASH